MCSCTSLSVFVYRVRALSATAPIYTMQASFCAGRRRKTCRVPSNKGDCSLQLPALSASELGVYVGDIHVIRSISVSSSLTRWLFFVYRVRALSTYIYRASFSLSLVVGKCYLNAYLHQIGKHQDGLCNHCNKPETVSFSNRMYLQYHMFVKCHLELHITLHYITSHA